MTFTNSLSLKQMSATVAVAVTLSAMLTTASGCSPGQGAQKQVEKSPETSRTTSREKAPAIVDSCSSPGASGSGKQPPDPVLWLKRSFLTFSEEEGGGYELMDLDGEYRDMEYPDLVKIPGIRSVVGRAGFGPIAWKSFSQLPQFVTDRAEAVACTKSLTLRGQIDHGHHTSNSH